MPVGVTRAIDGKQQIKISGDQVFSSAELAQLLPLQVINPGAFRLLEGGPKIEGSLLIGVCFTWNTRLWATGRG